MAPGERLDKLTLYEQFLERYRQKSAEELRTERENLQGRANPPELTISPSGSEPPDIALLRVRAIDRILSDRNE